jgi:uncharacterized cupredoxin-like copper-binding protein
MMRTRLGFAALSVCAVGALGVAGCGSSDNGSSSTSAQPATPAKTTAGGGAMKEGRLDLAADKSQLKFDKTSLSAKAGEVEIYLKNPAPIPHNVAVEGNGVDKKSATISGGKTTELKLNLKPGTYKFYCAVPGHEQAGMKGTLTVK